MLNFNYFYNVIIGVYISETFWIWGAFSNQGIKLTFFKSPRIKSPVSDGSIEPSLSSSNCLCKALILSNPSLSAVARYK